MGDVFPTLHLLETSGNSKPLKSKKNEVRSREESQSGSQESYFTDFLIGSIQVLVQDQLTSNV